jgi:hypothetical protein
MSSLPNSVMWRGNGDLASTRYTPNARDEKDFGYSNDGILLFDVFVLTHMC